MTEPLSKIPDGMRYYFGREAQLRRSVEDTAMKIFADRGYEEIVTPTVDYYSLFDHAMGHSESHRAFRFTDKDGRLLALRPDVTSAVARAAATLFATRKRPLRLCYVAPVFRQEPRSPAEWLRETTQIGGELIGCNSSAADIEVLQLVCQFLQSLNLEFLITLNHAEVFNGLTQFNDTVPVDELRRLIARRNLVELSSFLQRYDAGENEGLVQLTRLTGKGEILGQASQLITNKRSQAGLDYLRKLWKQIAELNLADSCEIDLGDVSPLDYYTGLTFKIFVMGAGKPLGSGGRYDGLTASFGADEPAVGFVLDLDAMTELLSRKEGKKCLE